MKYKLGELCNVVSGGTPSRAIAGFWDSGTIPWIKIGNIKGKYVGEADEYITQAGLEGSSTKMLSAGTILFTIFATLGEVGILTIKACTNQAIAGITIKNQSEVSTDYLYYFLKSKKSYVTALGRGVAQNNINLSILRNFEVPIPALPMQKQIVDVLDKAEKIIEARQQELQKLDELVKARFVELFGDPLGNDKGWQKALIAEVCNAIFGGGTPSKSHPEYFAGSIPWVSPKDMKSSVINDSIDHITEDAIAHSTTNLVPANSVLMVIRSGILKHTLPVAINSLPVTINQDMKAFVPNETVKTAFLLYFFKAIENDVLAGVRGVTADNIDFKAFQKRTIIVPPLALQEQFAAFVNQTDKSKVAVQKALDEAQLLFDSLMQKYFG